MSSAESTIISESEAGIRLDKALTALASIPSRERARQALRTGKVLVDGVFAGAEDGGRALRPGSVVEVQWNRPGTAERRVQGVQSIERAGLALIHHDDAIVLCDKPAGLLTDAADEKQAAKDDTLRKRVSAWLGGQQVWPAHRIDRYTTGLVCFARSSLVHERLAEQWAQHSPSRRYLAVLEGALPGPCGQFADWMVWDKAALLQRHSSAGASGAVLAEASWEVEERFGDRATLVSVRLKTGRRNQIRLHAMLAGHPVVGERLYRVGGPARVPHPRYALHAFQLGFTHPLTRANVSFEAPLPDDLRGLLDGLRGEGLSPLAAEVARGRSPASG